MTLNEGLIHVAMRGFLRQQGWKLIAGQYPGGTDDEVRIMNIYDPTVATDDSPDPRRHSLGKLVPDLVVYKSGILLIIEAKPRYHVEDRNKLVDLLGARREDLLRALRKFALEQNMPELLPAESLEIIPGLAFSASDKKYAQDHGFIVLRVQSMDSVLMEGPF